MWSRLGCRDEVPIYSLAWSRVASWDTNGVLDVLLVEHSYLELLVLRTCRFRFRGTIFHAVIGYATKANKV